MEGSRVEEDKPAGAKTSGSSSRYRGVGWQKANKKWQVRITVGGKVKSLGYFADEIAAARAYDAFVIAKKLNKPLNFSGGAAAKGHVVTLSTTSRFRGVSLNKTKKKWEVKIRFDGKRKFIGRFADSVPRLSVDAGLAPCSGCSRMLSTVEGTFVGQRTTLNGRELLLSGSVLPPLTPSAGVASDPLLVPPLSVAFVVLPEARVPACA